MDATTAAHAKAIENLERITQRLQDALGDVATKDDLKRVEGKIDGLVTTALNSAPPWAVREIAWLRSLVGAAAGALALAIGDWIKTHFGVGRT